MGELKIGGSTPDAIRLGSLVVDKVMMGTEQVWPPVTPITEDVQNLVAVQAGALLQINLSWDALAIQPDNYIIYRSLDGITYSVLKTLPGSSTSSFDTLVVDGGGYYYKMKAIDDGVESVNFSNIEYVKIPDVVPPNVTGLVVVQYGPGNDIEVSWNLQVPDPDEFVLRWTFDDGPYTNEEILAGTVSNYLITTIGNPGDNLDVWIKAKNGTTLSVNWTEETIIVE